jgi:hypothetical protein
MGGNPAIDTNEREALAVEKTIAIEMAETEPRITAIKLVIAESVLCWEIASAKMAYQIIHRSVCST